MNPRLLSSTPDAAVAHLRGKTDLRRCEGRTPALLSSELDKADGPESLPSIFGLEEGVSLYRVIKKELRSGIPKVTVW
jgi:hypothetical protein